MPHIAVPPGLPGIVSLMAFRPETAKPLSLLAETLLRGPSTLSPGEREMIAATVSTKNDCHFCASSHAAAAAAHTGDPALVDKVRQDFASAPISDKLKALMAIALQVREGGKRVTTDSVNRAKAVGATDVEIHDTVLIAAAFCMYNRYVDGLASFTPEDPNAYTDMGKLLASEGYVRAGQLTAEGKR